MDKETTRKRKREYTKEICEQRNGKKKELKRDKEREKDYSPVPSVPLASCVESHSNHVDDNCLKLA